MPASNPKSWFVILVILLAGLAVYAPLLGSYYSGYDDFTELYRAATSDSDHPAKIFTEPHQGTAKYRPLAHALVWVTFLAGDGDAAWFRWRNVLFHLLGALAVWKLARLGGQSAGGAVFTALAFALHPLAHQTVGAASWCNSTTYAITLWSLYLAASAWDAARPLPRLAAATFLFALAMFSYEPAIVILGSLAAWFALRWWRGERPASSWTALLTPAVAGGAIVLLGFAAAVRAFVHSTMPPTPPTAIVKNLILYLGSLALPVDLLLLNSLAGLPLPVELARNPAALAVAALPGILLLAVAAFLLFRYPALPRTRPVPALLWVWALSIPMALSPFLVFTDHASETYLYLPVAFWCLFVGGMLERYMRARVLMPFAASLLLLFAISTALRSARVRESAAIAQRIVHSLPLATWRQGAPEELYFTRDEAQAPGSPGYGIYNWKGLSTIDPATGEILAMESALRFETRNRLLRARALPRDGFLLKCGSNRSNPALQCYAVGAEGTVLPVP